MTSNWAHYDRAFIERRYDRLAGLIGFFDWLFFVPPTLRRESVACLRLKPGDHVLEIGSGTGRNLDFLCDAVGPHGKVYGVDLSVEMLKKADRLRRRNGWRNVELIRADVAGFVAPRPLDAVLFGFSYNTIPHHLNVLHHAWDQLRPSGRIVIMEAKAPSGWFGKLTLPFGAWLMKHTLLGNPFVRPWEDLAALTDDLAIKEYLFGAYYICHGSKSAPTSATRSTHASLIAAG